MNRRASFSLASTGSLGDVLHANHFESLGERDVIARRRARSPPANIIEREPRVRAHASLRAQTADVGVDFAFAFGVSRETIPRARQSLARRVVIADEDRSIVRVVIARAPTIIHALARVQIHHLAPRSQRRPRIGANAARLIPPSYNRSGAQFDVVTSAPPCAKYASHQPLDHHRVRHVADLHLVQARARVARASSSPSFRAQRPQRIPPPPALPAPRRRSFVQLSMHLRHERVIMRPLDVDLVARASRRVARRVRERRLPSSSASVQVHPSPAPRPSTRAVVERLERVQRRGLPVVARRRRARGVPRRRRRAARDASARVGASAHRRRRRATPRATSRAAPARARARARRRARRCASTDS